MLDGPIWLTKPLHQKAKKTMTFRLEKQTPGKTQTRFHVVDSANAIVGIITVANEATADLEKHWKGAPPQPSPKQNAAKARKQILAMIKAGRKPSKEAALRGC